MCGIAGEVRCDQSPVDVDALLAMSEAMHERGPDGAGLWQAPEGDVALAHRRLAIIDLSERGAQPMTSADGGVVVVFNGEIYNHSELRREYESRGAHYHSGSDTETLLHGYALDGPAFVRRLRGMFAFALWDRRQRRLVMARDPFGIKPLYYVQDGSRLRFASQVKALLAGGYSRDVDPAGLVSFYLWGYVIEPHTFYRGIRALPAGCVLLFQAESGPRVERYCDPLDALRGSDVSDTEVGSLHEALLDSVRYHLLADVPVGMFLSAGIDSGTLAALVTECAPAQEVQAVTLGFAEYAGTERDEVPLARKTAATYGMQHEVVEYGRADFEQDRAHLLAAMDQPTVDGVNTYFVANAMAARGFKAALSAVGGDEMFGGYPSFRQVPRLARWIPPVPRILGRATRHLLAPIVNRFSSSKYAGVLEYGGSVSGAYLLRRALFMPWEIPSLIGEEITAEGLEALDVFGSLDALIQGIESPYDQVMALEYAVYMRNCLLRDADWAGMAHGLEIRTPLVDHVLFATLLAIRRARRGFPFSKQEFASTPRHPLTAEHRNRSKTGFNVPVREWMMGDKFTGSHTRGLRPWAHALAKLLQRGDHNG